MECTDIREALSARLDGEDPGVPTSALDEHVATCAACAGWNDELSVLHRMVRVREAEAVPDLSAAIVDACAPGLTAARRRAPAPVRRSPVGEVISPARWGLFVVALTQLVLAAPALLLGEDAGATVHVARELGSFDVALAVGLLVAAWQPARAWGLFPLVAALGLVIAGTAGLDLIDGSTSTVSEAHHLLDLAGVALVWLVARDAATSPGPTSVPSA
jgi:predicted anti-sigma-YlaC factor YlaD